tara:strand:+ start:1767 stop:2162 length:396 start_codon:yes stop_codon:yes gene_type:complete
MVNHRSIVRIRQNDNSKICLNICFFIFFCIILNIIFRKKWIFINVISFLIIFLFWLRYKLKKRQLQQQQQQLQQQQIFFPQIENDYSLEDNIATANAEFLYDDDNTVTAIPISPSNQCNNEDDITVVAVEI